MRKNVIIWSMILLLVVCSGLALAQVMPPDPTPPNPAPNIPTPNIPTPQVPRVTPPAQPVAPTPATSEPISPTDPAPANTEKPPAKSQPDNDTAGQDPIEYMFMALIALIILGFGIVIGRMSVRPKSK